METRPDLRPGLCLRAGTGWDLSSWFLPDSNGTRAF